MNIKTIYSDGFINPESKTISFSKKKIFTDWKKPMLPQSILVSNNKTLLNSDIRKKYKSQIIHHQARNQIQNCIKLGNNPYQLMIQPNIERTQKFDWLLEAQQLQKQKKEEIQTKLCEIGLKRKQHHSLVQLKQTIMKHCMNNIKLKQNEEANLKNQLIKKKIKLKFVNYSFPRKPNTERKNLQISNKNQIRLVENSETTQSQHLYRMQFKNNEMKPILLKAKKNQRKFVKINSNIKKQFNRLQSILSKQKLQNRQKKLYQYFKSNDS